MVCPRFVPLIVGLSLLAVASTIGAQESGHFSRRERMAQRRAAAASPDTANAAPLALGAGTHTLPLRYQGRSRKVVVHVPPRYDPATPMPLVLAFHGGGGFAVYMAGEDRYGLIGKADRAGFVLVFPNGDSKFPGGRPSGPGPGIGRRAGC